MALRISKLSKNCASRGLVGPFRRAQRAKKGPPGLQGGGAAVPAAPLGYVPGLPHRLSFIDFFKYEGVMRWSIFPGMPHRSTQGESGS